MKRSSPIAIPESTHKKRALSVVGILDLVDQSQPDWYKQVFALCGHVRGKNINLSQQFQHCCSHLINEEENRGLAEESFYDLLQVANSLPTESIYFLPYKFRLQKALLCCRDTIFEIVKQEMESTFQFKFLIFEDHIQNISFEFRSRLLQKLFPNTNEYANPFMLIALKQVLETDDLFKKIKKNE